MKDPITLRLSDIAHQQLSFFFSTKNLHSHRAYFYREKLSSLKNNELEDSFPILDYMVKLFYRHFILLNVLSHYQKSEDIEGNRPHRFKYIQLMYNYVKLVCMCKLTDLCITIR